MATAALITWIPICVTLFAFLPPARAAVSAYLGGWLLLPVAAIPIEGFWDIDKVLATNVGVVLGALLFCPRRFTGYRVNLADVLLAIFACGTCVTSLTNGLGIHDGISSLGHKLFYYAIPFWLGRGLLKDRRDLLAASRLIVCGAALYAVLAFWEWRMSPQIHQTLYGFFQHSFAQHHRWGFYRPVVCFPHALALGMFMAWTSLLAIALYRSRQLRPVMGVPSGALVLLPLLGLATSMSRGPCGLFLAGVGTLLFWRGRRQRWLVWLLVAFALAWMACRFTGLSDGQWLSSSVETISRDGAGSLQFRINAESLQIEHAKQRPLFGWGSWNRGRAEDPSRRRLVVTDGLWIVLLAKYGVVGLLSFYLWWCWPLFMIASAGSNLERDPALMVVLIAVAMQSINFLFNSALSPVLTVMCGGAVTSLARLKCEAQTATAKRSD